MKSSTTKRTVIAAFALLLSALALWRWNHATPESSSSRRSTPPAFPSLVMTNGPTFKAQATRQPFAAVTNAALKQLISAIAPTASNLNAAVGTVPGRKYYTALTPLPSQVPALQRLHAQSGGTLQAFLRPESRVPIELKGAPLAPPNAAFAGQPDAAERSARTFLTDYREVFQLARPETELKLTHSETDTLGHTVLRFAQFHRGLEVWPGELSVQLDPVGAINLAHATTAPTPEGIATTPRVTAAEAVQKARASVSSGEAGKASEATLLIYAPVDKAARLAWKLELDLALDQHWQCVVDALTGEPLKVANMCMAANVAGSGVDLLGITRPLNVDQRGSTYYLRDESKPMFDPVATNGYILIMDGRDATYGSITTNNALLYYFTSTSPNTWSVPDSVSAAYNFSQVYDYYSERHSRNSYNDKGSNMLAIVRVGSYQNASWNPNFKLMFFGDVDRYAASLDVIGHELTHGVTYSIGAKGILDYHDQPGALNESFSVPRRL